MRFTMNDHDLLCRPQLVTIRHVGFIRGMLVGGTVVLLVQFLASWL